eukprot:1622042-Amphidinium_carterae.1
MGSVFGATSLHESAEHAYKYNAKLSKTSWISSGCEFCSARALHKHRTSHTFCLIEISFCIQSEQ